MTHDPATTTIVELIDHVKVHLTPDAHLDHLTDYDVHAIVGLTLHSVLHFGLTLVPLVPASDTPEQLATATSEVGATSLIDVTNPTVPVALAIVALAAWQSIVRRLVAFGDWLDAHLESPS